MTPLKDKKGITNTNAIQKNLDESGRDTNITGCITNKVGVDKSSEFYNKSIKSWLQDNDIEIYSTHCC